MNFAAENWLSAIKSSSLSLPIAQILSDTGLLQSRFFPTAEALNASVKQWHERWPGPVFRGQSDISEGEHRYYETIISEDSVVPTRENNWHDLFNALIWLQFPKTKMYLNQLHVKDISEYGAHPRTVRRNHITHFDECGVVLAVPANKIAQGNELLTDLSLHKWKAVFCERKSVWFDSVFPIVFGHANLEMLLNPFIGLTGKWLAVVVDDNFASMSAQTQSQCVDAALLQRCQEMGDFTDKGVLKPIPLLGIPGWYAKPSRVFYDDEAYFRPLRKGAAGCTQLPLSSPPTPNL